MVQIEKLKMMYCALFIYNINISYSNFGKWEINTRAVRGADSCYCGKGHDSDGTTDCCVWECMGGSHLSQMMFWHEYYEYYGVMKACNMDINLWNVLKQTGTPILNHHDVCVGQSWEICTLIQEDIGISSIHVLTDNSKL